MTWQELAEKVYDMSPEQKNMPVTISYRNRYNERIFDDEADLEFQVDKPNQSKPYLI